MSKTDVQQRILELLRVRDNIKEGNKLYVEYGRLTESEATEIKKIISVDVTGFVRSIDISGIKHAFSRHPDLKESDFLLIPFIVKNYDFIGEGKRPGTVVYKKKIGKEFFYVEHLRTGRKKLAMLTFYKRKSRPK